MPKPELRVETEVPTEAIMLLDPFEIEIDEAVNVRPFSTQVEESEADQQALEDLMRSIDENGQEQPIGVRINGDGKPKLTWGSRRLQAVKMLNVGRDTALPVKAIIDHSPDAFRAAFDENDKRKQMSPMDRALNFKRVREKESWTGPKGDKKLADYFGVNVATIVQYRKLENLTREVQVKVNSGVLTMDAALVVASAGKGKSEPERKEIQEQIIADAVVEERKRTAEAGDAAAETAVITGVPGRKKKVRQARGGKAGVSAASVKKAARAHGETISRSRKDILEFFEGENGPAYKEPVRDFITYLLKWADGDGTDRTLRDKFKEAVGKAGLSSQSEIKASKAVVVTSMTVKPTKKKKAAKKK